MVMTDKIADAFNFFRCIANLLQKFACYRRSLLLLNFTCAVTGTVLGFTRLNTAVMHKTCRHNKLCQLPMTRQRTEAPNQRFILLFIILFIILLGTLI